MRWSLLLSVGLFFSCGPKAPEGSLCERTFEPYPDIVSSRTRTHLNEAYLDAMALYNRGDYAGARDGFIHFLKVQRAELTPYIYLASSYLALGEPYEAELQLDHLQRSNILQFRDQIEWYRVVCWVCSDQLDRARVGAQKIVTAKAHTYSNEARALLKQLDTASKE